MIQLQIPRDIPEHARDAYKLGWFGRRDIFLELIIEAFMISWENDFLRIQTVGRLSEKRKAYQAGLEHRNKTLKGGL